MAAKNSKIARKKNTFFRLASVLNIDRAEKTIKTSIGDLTYNKLIIATGATNNFFNNSSIEENALPMKSLTEALDLRSKILENFEKALNKTDLKERERLMNVVIVGAGPTGVELAGSLAELRNKILPKDFPDLDLRIMNIHLIEAAPCVLNAMSEESSNRAKKYLKKLNVNIWTDTMVQSFENGVVKTSGEKEFESDTLVWAAGVKGEFPEGIHIDDIGRGNRIIVNEYCQMREDENIYALGDVGLIQSEKYPNGLAMMGSVAMQQGAYLAKTLNNKIKGRKTEPFIYNDKGTMATIGRNLAVVDLNKIKLKGMFAWLTWMFVHLMLLVGFRNRLVVFINWTWNYIRYNNGLRLIVRPYRKKNPKP